jgi:DNA-binding MarR family transcriptional regulator
MIFVQANNLETEVLVSLRRIVRAIDQHSNRLGKEFGLTTPQLLVLQTVANTKEQPIRVISAEVNLSQATVTSIVDRLERRGLLERQRSVVDRRKVFLVITDAGKDLLLKAPKPLQENFLHRFEGLREWEQHQLVFVLQQVAEMMGARHIDAAPLLDTGEITRGYLTPKTTPDLEPTGPTDNP